LPCLPASQPAGKLARPPSAGLAELTRSSELPTQRQQRRQQQQQVLGAARLEGGKIVCLLLQSNDRNNKLVPLARLDV